MNKLNQITQALADAGLIDNAVGMQAAKPSEYIFEAERNVQLEAKRDAAGAVVAKAIKEVKALEAKLAKAKSDEVKSDLTAKLAAAKAEQETAEAAAAELDDLTDPVTDAKFISEIVRYARNALMYALYDDMVRSKPAADGEAPVPLESAYELTDGLGNEAVGTPLSKEEARVFAAVADRIWQHHANISDTSWLNGFESTDLVMDAEGKPVLDANGNFQFETVVRKPIASSFKEHLQGLVGEARTRIAAKLPLSSFHKVAMYVAQTCHDLDVPHMDIDEAKESFQLWLDEIPFNPDPTKVATRREIIVARVADRKWAAFINALLSNNQRELARAQRDWIILSYSPAAKSAISNIKAHPLYKKLLAQRELETLEGKKMELALERARMEVEQSTQMFQVQRMEMQAEHLAFKAKMADAQKALAEKMAALGIPLH